MSDEGGGRGLAPLITGTVLADRLSWAQRQVQPPAQWRLSPEDYLGILSHNSHPTTDIEVRGRIQRPDGRVYPLRYVHVPLRDRTGRVEGMQVGPGFVLSIVAVPTANDVRRGQTFVTLFVSHQQLPALAFAGVLAQGYAVSGTILGGPQGPDTSYVEGPGVLRSITGTTPAAGAEISETVPTRARWRFYAMRFNLTASGSPGARSVRLIVDDGTNEFYRTEGSAGPGPGGTSFFGASRGFAAPHVGGVVTLPLAPDLQLLQGWRIRTSTLALDVADQFTAPQMFVEELIEN